MLAMWKLCLLVGHFIIFANIITIDIHMVKHVYMHDNRLLIRAILDPSPGRALILHITLTTYSQYPRRVRLQGTIKAFVYISCPCFARIFQAHPSPLTNVWQSPQYPATR